MAEVNDKDAHRAQMKGGCTIHCFKIKTSRDGHKVKVPRSGAENREEQ